MIQIGAAHRRKAAQIAFATNVNPSSVSRENKRNRIPDGDGTVERERAQRLPFVCAGCPKKHARSLAYNPTEAMKEAFGEELFEKLIDAVRKLKA